MSSARSSSSRRAALDFLLTRSQDFTVDQSSSIRSNCNTSYSKRYDYQLFSDKNALSTIKNAQDAMKTADLILNQQADCMNLQKKSSKNIKSIYSAYFSSEDNASPLLTRQKTVKSPLNNLKVKQLQPPESPKMPDSSSHHNNYYVRPSSRAMTTTTASGSSSLLKSPRQAQPFQPFGNERDSLGFILDPSTDYGKKYLQNVRKQLTSFPVETQRISLLVPPSHQNVLILKKGIHFFGKGTKLKTKRYDGNVILSHYEYFEKEKPQQEDLIVQDDGVLGDGEQYEAGIDASKLNHSYSQGIPIINNEEDGNTDHKANSPSSVLPTAASGENLTIKDGSSVKIIPNNHKRKNRNDNNKQTGIRSAEVNDGISLNLEESDLGLQNNISMEGGGTPAIVTMPQIKKQTPGYLSSSPRIGSMRSVRSDPRIRCETDGMTSNSALSNEELIEQQVIHDPAVQFVQVKMKQKGNEEEIINLGKFVILPEEKERLEKQSNELVNASHSSTYFRWKMNALDEAQLVEMKRKAQKPKVQLPKISIYNPKKYISIENPAPGNYDPSYSAIQKRSPKVDFDKGTKVGIFENSTPAQNKEEQSVVLVSKKQVVPPKEEGYEIMFSELMKDVRREVQMQKKNKQELQHPLKGFQLSAIPHENITDLNREIKDKVAYCKSCLNNIKYYIRAEDSEFKKMQE